ncbi:MAG: type III-B CRISPR module-associated protein Cmr3 [Nitrospirae bacterium]|nr:type III-B CRISPR module-associated protein Cmr3 [Nitrospirota bacterium]
MKIFIEPNDVLMFRDGRPFAGGDDHFARGIFPPSPATIYGALRSHMLSNKSGEFDTFKSDASKISKHITDEIGTPDKLGLFALTQFTLAKRNGSIIEQFFTMPKDVVKKKGSEDLRHYGLMPQNFSEGKIMTDLPSGLINMWYPSEDTMEAVSGFLSVKEMADYLNGKVPSIVAETKYLFDKEERTGIRKSKTLRSVETGGLYSVEYFRLNKDVGFAVEVENTNLLPESGILRLGGDNRAAKYSKASWNGIHAENIKKKIAQNNHFKLVLTTPAIFKKGWIPEGIDSNTMQGAINGIELKLISACLGKPVGIGGYDFVKNHPKVMKKAVPAGSVYYFELKEGAVDSLFDRLWLKSISDERAQEGFGITLIGGY